MPGADGAELAYGRYTHDEAMVEAMRQIFIEHPDYYEFRGVLLRFHLPDEDAAQWTFGEDFMADAVSELNKWFHVDVDGRTYSNGGYLVTVYHDAHPDDTRIVVSGPRAEGDPKRWDRPVSILEVQEVGT